MADRNSDTSSLSPPGSGTSSTQKRETLTSRAKRIIGRVLDVSEEAPTLPDTATRAQKARKSPNRRREQVLQAQRTHRQRTQGYIRELEKEVLRLRDSEAALKSENASLKDILSQNGLPVPGARSPISPRGDGSPEDFNPLLTEPSPMTGDTSSAASVTIDLTELTTIDAEKWCSITAAMEDTRPYEPPTISPSQLSGGANSAMPLTLRKGSAGNYGSTPALSAQAAIDFVLELERPCLPHVKYTHTQEVQFPRLGGRAAPDFNHGPHHVFTTAASLLSSGLSSDPLHQPFLMPAQSLEKLFQASMSLNLGDDVTPVQIWANIRRIAMKFSLDITMLQLLKNEFMKYSRCNSFGTVIHRDTVSSVLSFFFPGEEFQPVWS